MSVFLYCFEAPVVKIAKVGVSSAVDARFSVVAGQAPFAMRVSKVVFFEDSALACATERMIIGNADRYRSHGEWVVVNDRLHSLFAGVSGGQDVSDTYAHLEINGRQIIDPSESRILLRRAQYIAKFGPSSKADVSRLTDDADFDAATLRKRINEGYGADDVLALDGIPREAYWAEIGRRRDVAAARVQGGAA